MKLLLVALAACTILLRAEDEEEICVGPSAAVKVTVAELSSTPRVYAYTVVHSLSKKVVGIGVGQGAAAADNMVAEDDSIPTALDAPAG
jgi:hypothetical protein